MYYLIQLIIHNMNLNEFYTNQYHFQILILKHIYIILTKLSAYVVFKSSLYFNESFEHIKCIIILINAVVYFDDG